MPTAPRSGLPPGMYENGRKPRNTNLALYLALGLGGFFIFLLIIFMLFLNAGEKKMERTVNEYRQKAEDFRRMDSLRRDSIMRIQEELMNE